MGALFKLINIYFWKGFFSPFFLFFFPILILFLMGNLFLGTLSSLPSDAQKGTTEILVLGIAAMQLVSIGLFSIPATLAEFKNSVLMKRIGSTNIKPWQFLLVILGFYTIVCFISFFYVLLWGSIIFANKFGFGFVWTTGILKALPWMFLLLLCASSFGLMLVALIKKTEGVLLVGNILYFPISILSGGFGPKSSIQNNDVLNALTWVNPFKYIIDPYFTSFNDDVAPMLQTHLSSTEWIVYPIVAVIFLAFTAFMTIRNLKWSK